MIYETELPNSVGGVNRPKAEKLFNEHQQAIYQHTDKMFAVLMAIQWLAGIAAAFWIAPLTWVGSESQTNIHVWTAIFLGGLIAALPIGLALWRPGHFTTRYVIAVGQMLMSALLIHLTGGRLETHFHIFGSLAFLSFYRDWRVLIPATLVVAGDHVLRGIFWPESIYGLISASSFRWMEHAGWVIFEDIFLYIAIKRSVNEMWNIAKTAAKVNSLNQSLEHRVRERTLQLESTNEDLGREIEERRQTEEALRVSENRFRSVVESAHDAIISTDHFGCIISWNESARKIFGYEEKEITLKPIAKLFPENYSRPLRDKGYGSDILTSGLLHGDNKTIDLRGLRKDGSEFPLEISLSSWETTEGVFYSGIVRDVTERKSLEDQLTHQALHDPLTKLANRLLFTDRVKHALEKVERNRTPVSVLFLDLDNFKNINDTLGHSAGDELLVSVARRLQDCLRPSDTAARMGGDEFAVLVEGTTSEYGGTLIAERIHDILRTPFMVEGREIFIGTSIGIVTTIEGNEDPAELLRNADVAMYTAKSQGKDRYALFESEMHNVLVKRAELEADMRRALEHSEFEVYYQPIIDLQSERIMGMEALTRWNHPTRGLVSPLDFIPVAEETNLIIPLGRWVLEEACHQARKWQTQNNNQYGDQLSITVNVSGRQFKDDGLISDIQAVLVKSGLPASSLVLEITESTMLTNTEATLAKLNQLKRLGVKLAIDDFGTGYSSLSYLQRFPVDILKIDKSFIDKIDQDKEGSAVAKAIITMSDTLQLQTIAEGIETPGQSSKLIGLGCEWGQGFHYAHPLRKEAMTAFLQVSAKNGFASWDTLSRSHDSTITEHLSGLLN